MFLWLQGLLHIDYNRTSITILKWDFGQELLICSLNNYFQMAEHFVNTLGFIVFGNKIQSPK